MTTNRARQPTARPPRASAPRFAPPILQLQPLLPPFALVVPLCDPPLPVAPPLPLSPEQPCAPASLVPPCWPPLEPLAPPVLPVLPPLLAPPQRLPGHLHVPSRPHRSTVRPLRRSQPRFCPRFRPMSPRPHFQAISSRPSFQLMSAHPHFRLCRQLRRPPHRQSRSAVPSCVASMRPDRPARRPEWQSAIPKYYSH